MIYQINKYHRTEAGEACTAVKVEKAEQHEAYEKAMADFYQYAHDYMADNTVLQWSIAIIEPETMVMRMSKTYTKYVEPSEEQAETEASAE